MEWLEAWVFGNTEDGFLIVFCFLHSFDEGTLTGVEDVDATPLEEEYVGNFTASDDVAILIEGVHGVA